MNLNKQFQWLTGRSAAVGLTASAPLAAELATSAAAATPPTPFDAALHEFEHCRWHEAYARLAALADGGHPDAARIALLMHAHGTRLFGGHFGAEPTRRNRWLDAAAAAGFPGSR